MIRPPLLTPSQRANLLSFCAAMYGLAIAIAAYPLWLRPAPPDQLPAYMTALHLDAHASFRFFASVVVLTLAMPFALRRVVDLLMRADARPWARNGAAAAMVVALWYASVARDLAWTVLPAAAAIAVCVALRRIDAGFTRRDAILLPAIAAMFVTMLDLTKLSVERAFLAAVCITFTMRLALIVIRRADGLPAPHCFAAAPLALILESHFFAGAQRYAGWPSFLLIVISPVLLRSLVRDTPSSRARLRAVILFVSYPLAAVGYASSTSIVTAEGRPRVEFFEAGQHLGPANEVFRGEKPYRDIVPPHGLIQDALFDVAMLRHGPVAIGTALKARGSLSALTPVVGYALAAGVTGSADAAVFSVFGAALFQYATGSPRFLPSLLALACGVWAVRRRSRGLAAVAGVLSVLAFFTSLEFGMYAAISTIVAAFFCTRSPRERLRSIATTVAAAVAAFVIACIGMAMAGYLTDFFRVTFTEIATLGPVYVLMPFTPQLSFSRAFPEVLSAAFDGRTLPYVVWIAALLGTAVVLARGIRATGRRRVSAEALIVIATWLIAGGISYAERQHIYFHFAIMPFCIGVTWWLLRARSSASRSAGVALVAVLLVAAAITSHISVVGILRRTRGPLETGWHEVGLPRAQGALFRDSDIAVIDTVYRYSNAHLRGDDTFFDFTNRALLYFLLDKNIPVRQIEPAFYETEQRQREVIALIQNNPWVKFAIVPTGPDQGVDDVGNEVRAPLVWKYLQENFEPDLHEGAVEIWKRK